MPGVKGLAAMFEQRGDASPPDLTRGRSPNALSGTPPLSDSPRPLSKIRTQFVAVEKDGRIGLTRGISTDSIGSSRRASNETGTTTPQPRSEPTSDPFIETPAALSKVTSNPISTPKSRSQSPQKPPAPIGRMSPLKNTGTSTPEVMPNANPDKITDEEETKTRLQPGLPTDKLAVRGNHNAGSNGIGDSLKSASTPAPAAEVKAPKSIATPAPTAEVKTPKSIATPATEDKGPKGVSAPATEDKAPKSINAPAKATLAPVTTAKTASKAPKSPMVSKAPKSPQPTKAPKSPTKETLKAPALAPTKKTSTADLKESHKKSVATAPAPVTASSTSTAKKPASLVVPSSGTGFVKPKVKSPTRPVKLPAGLTSHTASSSSRGNVGVSAPAPAQPGKRSCSVAPSATSQRPASRISTAGTGDGARTLRRQSSSINGSTRQSIGSIGPPPKQVAQDAPKKDYHVDEGFLARLMRPTQSSASKTTEKAPVTPPRRQAAPKSAPRHAVGADATASAKKAAAKLQAAGSTKSKDAASERTKGLGSPLGSAVSSGPKPDAAPENKSGSPKRSERAPTIEAPASGLEEQMANLTVKDEAKPVEREDNNDVQPTERTSIEAPEVAEGSNEPEVTKEDSTTSEVAVPELSEKAIPVVTDEPLKVEDIEDIVHEVPDMPEAATSEKESTIEAAPVAASSDETNKVGGEVKEEDEDMATPAAP